MTTQAINESGMTFGPYPVGNCYYIEKSECYAAVKEGVKMAEFLLLQQQKRGRALWVVEAKSSSPRPETQPNFDEFINEIRTKFTNAFLLVVAALLQRHPAAKAELPSTFKALDLRVQEFRFVLVINGHKEEWLASLQNALALALKPLVRTWALPTASVAVLNQDVAKKYGLILPVT